MTENERVSERRVQPDSPPSSLGRPARQKPTLRSFRLTSECDLLLRFSPARRGDIKKRILAAFSMQDLMSIPLDEPPEAPAGRKLTTTADISDEIYARVLGAAARRRVSAARLVNCAIIHYYSARQSAPAGQGAA